MATATQTTVLKTAIATYPHTQGLKDGTVTAPGIQFEHVDITPIVAAFRRMCRALEFDVAEMAITTYLTARAYHKPFTALPVFVLRQFHHSPIVYHVKSGVESPRDLEGKKVGVRAYTVTTGVWVRGILATEYGVDLSKITWVLADEEHVEEYHKDYPSNVIYQAGANLGAMVAFLQQLSSGAELSGEAQVLAQRRSLVGDDPLPYGLARNRKAIEAVIQFAQDQ